MGIRSKRHLQNKAAEQEKKIKDDAQAFNKAFTDKTYTVAKKVIENVEKVADYDYEAFFSRVNKVFEDPTKINNNVNRAERSKALEEKLKEKGFNIKSTTATPKDYRDSIIEKTKKNIQKKITEAETRTINTNEIKNVPKINFPEIKSVPNLESQNFKDQITAKEEPSKEVMPDAFISEQENDQDETVISQEIFEENDILLETSKLTIEKETMDQENFEPKINIETEDIALEDNLIDSEPLKTEVLEEQFPKETLMPNEVEVKGIEEILQNASYVEEPAVEAHEVSIIKEDLTTIEVKEPVESIVKNPQEEVTQNESFETSNQFFTDDYSKDKTKKNKKYYKEKQKEKFAKRMKVELEDNLIVKKKRSMTRLFKFSLSFKLSFVFIVLLMFTVVTLSVAFYFGIDYVINLREIGKMEDIQFFKDVLLVLLIIFNLVAILLSVSISTKTSRGLVSPLNEMTRIVQQINAKEMDRRLNVTGMHDELKELATTFNEMLDRIENSYETQNRFTSDASHELRTPIAVIQGYINMLDRWGKADGAILDESIEAIKSESNNMKRLTEKLLLLAKADKGILELDFQPFSLKDLIDEITKETCMIDSEHTITNTINDVEQIVADRESLKQAIRIFVDNSVKYTPSGGHIQINSYFRKKKIYIEIADDGIGIAKEDMDNIFNRFYRVDKSRSKESGGHGLGLSISKWIINEHKGEIEVKSEIDKGTVVTIILTPMT